MLQHFVASAGTHAAPCLPADPTNNLKDPHWCLLHPNTSWTAFGDVHPVAWIHKPPNHTVYILKTQVYTASRSIHNLKQTLELSLMWLFVRISSLWTPLVVLHKNQWFLSTCGPVLVCQIIIISGRQGGLGLRWQFLIIPTHIQRFILELGNQYDLPPTYV